MKNLILNIEKNTINVPKITNLDLELKKGINKLIT